MSTFKLNYELKVCFGSLLTPLINYPAEIRASSANKLVDEFNVIMSCCVAAWDDKLQELVYLHLSLFGLPLVGMIPVCKY